MAKSIGNSVLDAALNYVKTNATQITVCTTEPTTYAQAITSNKLAIDSIASFGSPADNGSDGRKIQIPAHNSVAVDTGSSAAHVALVDLSSTDLLLVTTCSSQALTASNTVNIPVFSFAITDPT